MWNVDVNHSYESRTQPRLAGFILLEGGSGICSVGIVADVGQSSTAPSFLDWSRLCQSSSETYPNSRAFRGGLRQGFGADEG